MAHDAFRAVGVYDVYLTPDNQISRRADYAHPIDKYFLPASETLLALERQRALVYDASGPRLVECDAAILETGALEVERGAVGSSPWWKFRSAKNGYPPIPVIRLD